MKNNFKKGFTLIELVMVIVIVGIISTIATDIYLNIYRNYVYSKIINELEYKTDALLEKISAMLTDRVKGSVIGRKPEISHAINKDIISIYDSKLDEKYTILEWIGASSESRNFGGANSIGWSGFADIDNSSLAVGLISPGSNFKDIKDNSILVGSNSNNLAVIFNHLLIGDGNGYGFYGTSGASNNIMNVSLQNNQEVLKVPSSAYSGDISENYILAHTAYAIVPDEVVNGRFNLRLFYNYRPWNGGQTYQNGTSTILARDVTVFRFRSLEQNIEVKICMQGQNLKEDGTTTPNSFGDGFIVCKTKVVY
ncbi:putative type II secretion system protein [Campylobacter blaseri]|uniref:Prepilin-type cleavage/methylation domain-containing protein n=1 Tax=Campylobacter blaseri TaxID=2042961 RepID=A0A2P8R200_9BACT|nr:prepilin-type N-terminal cleavage/methylation domain-containing protein [Campylobacter blaseri]PSM52526.1 prepilin-type cleavage/methylation domain-containing protein [Campylobacter blaseri]PSM54174.1 prepilin-type cleavage/methylation domain-containing protein [Campylobacter blaseri]QKF85824.1 putative type II secretion system protein [Campylobacter blaseri]